jgi:hypothetical protein
MEVEVDTRPPYALPTLSVRYGLACSRFPQIDRPRPPVIEAGELAAEGASEESQKSKARG